MLKEEFKNIKERKKDLRQFGFTVGGVILIIGAVLYYALAKAGMESKVLEMAAAPAEAAEPEAPAKEATATDAPSEEKSK